MTINGEPESVPTTPAGHDGTGGKIIILAVERDLHVRKLERYFLEQAGYKVEFSDDGVQALEQARRLLPDLLISEILVARLDGLSVCRAMKSDPATRHIPVLIFSILSAEDRAREAGADMFLKKPLDDNRLITTIEQLLAQYAAMGGATNGAN